MEQERLWGIESSPEFVRQARDGCRMASDLSSDPQAGSARWLRKVRRVWVETEMPSICLEPWARIWRIVASSPAGRSKVMSWRERRFVRALPVQITVFRGGGSGGERSWSWTLDRSVAEDFARRGLDSATYEPLLCQARIDKATVIAYFRLGGEHEVILDPGRLNWDDVDVELFHR